MGLKHHTVILVPHSRAKFRKWRVSNRQILLVGSSLALLVGVSAISTFSFFAKAVDKHQLATLAEENQQLRQVNQEFETSIRELKTHLAEYEQRTHELAIVAGLDGLDLDQQSGVGGLGLEDRYLDLGEKLGQIQNRLDERDRLIAATPAISPVRGILTSGYGTRTDPVSGKQTLHRAVDLSTAPGRPVFATADGIVLNAERSGRLGNSILLSHGFGFSTRYAHLSRFNVETGQTVRRGKVIGNVGNTGRTTGYHLHYEVRLDGKPVDPMTFILDETLRRF